MASPVHFLRWTQRWAVLIVLALILVALPIVVSWTYNYFTAFPEVISIASGSEGGRYHPFAESLAREIHEQLDVKVREISSRGSLENLLLLRAGKADFALYQPGVEEVLRIHDPDDFTEARAEVDLLPAGARNVAFVANLYSQPAHLVVRRGANIRTPADLEGKTVAVGLSLSGDYAMSLILLDHFDLTDKIQAVRLDFGEVEQAFEHGTIDAAFYTMGVHAPIFRRLARTDRCDFLDIPIGHALADKYIFVYQYEIPAGLYGYLPRAVPESTVKTVAVGAQLLTRADVNTNLVEAVTRTVLSKNFVRNNHLRELFEGQHEFALRTPDFPLHQGAQNVYDPELRPLVNPDFVASTEGIRSFFFAAAVAGFLGWQWLKKKREHKLEEYMSSLLEIERQQMSAHRDDGPSEVERLRKLLDKVTFLRQEALRKFSAHEFSGDRAADCFIQMCHSLSNKINAKISRHHLEARFDQLTEVIKENSARTDE